MDWGLWRFSFLQASYLQLIEKVNNSKYYWKPDFRRLFLSRFFEWWIRFSIWVFVYGHVPGNVEHARKQSHPEVPCRSFPKTWIIWVFVFFLALFYKEPDDGDWIGDYCVYFHWSQNWFRQVNRPACVVILVSRYRFYHPFFSITSDLNN